MTIVQLKSILTDLSLPVSGNKTKLIQRIKSTDYFFLTSPIHFKIDVKHQDIPFILILKFNGYIWEVQKITIPYKELIDPENISLSN